MKRSFAVLAAFLLLVGPAAAIAVPTMQAETAETVAIAFDPPLDRPLVFRRSKEVRRSGRPATNVSGRIELTVSRAENGFRVRVRSLDFQVTSADPAAPRAAQEIEEPSEPFVLLLDNDGAILGLEDEEEYWAATMRSAERLAIARASSPEGRDGVAHAMNLLRAMPREARLTMLTEAVAPVFEFGAAEMTLGQPLSAALDTPSPFGGTVTMDVEVMPERVAEDHLFVRMRGSVSREDLQRLIERFVAQIPVTGQGNNTEAERARGMEQLREADLSRRFHADYEVELDTGVTRSLRLVDRIRTGVGDQQNEQTTTVILERLE